jgi:hypothetical protein
MIIHSPVSITGNLSNSETVSNSVKISNLFRNVNFVSAQLLVIDQTPDRDMVPRMAENNITHYNIAFVNSEC